MDKPTFIHRDGIIADKAYLEWLSDIKKRFHRHHTDIISRCKSVEEALFYIHKTVDNNWSRSVLDNNLDADLYKTQGSAITNFSSKLPVPQSYLAQNLLKDPYDFSFLTLRICKSHDKTTVEWSFRGIERPIGVASYQLQEVVDRTIAEIEMKNKETEE